MDASMKSRSVLERIASFQPRERASERVLLIGRRGKPTHCLPQDLAVSELSVNLELRLENVVPHEQRIGAFLAEDARELAANAAVPVDQRPVAVEGGPAIHSRD